jgi:hypothetical protein
LTPELAELLVPELPEPAPVVLAPESFKELAVNVPLPCLSPCTTTESPGRTAALDTLRLLVMLVAEDNFTAIVLPVMSLT